MGIFTNLATDLLKQEQEANKLIEDVTSLSNDEISRIANFVIDGMEEGHGDATELAHEALENVAGMETADDSTINSIIKKITSAVSAKTKKK